MATATLDATVGGGSSNTYATLAEADQYHENRPASSQVWTSTQPTDDEKNKALLFATLQMQAIIEWTGSPNTTAQALAWPRQGMVEPNGASVSSSVIPQQIKDAQSEFARQLIKSDLTADSAIEKYGVEKLKVGSVDIAFSASTAAKVIPDAVLNLIPDEWVSSKGASSLNVALERA